MSSLESKGLKKESTIWLFVTVQAYSVLILLSVQQFSVASWLTSAFSLLCLFWRSSSHSCSLGESLLWARVSQDDCAANSLQSMSLFSCMFPYRFFLFLPYMSSAGVKEDSLFCLKEASPNSETSIWNSSLSWCCPACFNKGATHSAGITAVCCLSP